MAIRGGQGVVLEAGRFGGPVSGPRHLAGVVPWLVWAAAVLLAGLGVLLSAIDGLSFADIVARFIAANALGAITFGGAGAVIASRRPGNRVGWLLCTVGLLSGAEAFAGPYARHALLAISGDLPGGQLAGWINRWLWVLPLGLTALVLPLIFPDGRPPSRSWRPLVWLVGVTTGLLVAVVALGSGPDASLPEGGATPFGEVSHPLLSVGTALLVPLLVVSFVGVLAAVAVRYRQSQGVERRQLHWFAYAAGFVLAASLVPVLLGSLGLAPSDTLLIGAAQAVALPCVAVAVSLAILRDRLYGLDLLIQLRRSNERLLSVREQLISAREEERRRLRRDLHDGLGPRLAGLTLRLESARDRMARDPEAEALLADLAERARDAVADVRRLVYGLRPPALDDLGLVAALREAAAQSAGDRGPAVEIEAPDALPALPAAVEVAAYRIVQEALTNAVRHAGASRCVARLALDGATGSLRIDVEDDGRGLRPGERTGVGLGSMRERAEELGGTFHIEPLPGGGTRVRAVLPAGDRETRDGAERGAVGR